MAEAKIKLWLPWKYKMGETETRLCSDDVYEALGEARASQEFIIHNKGLTLEPRLEKERNIAILQSIEDNLRAMFKEAIRTTPKETIPGRKK